MSSTYVDHPFVTPAGVRGAPFQARYERIDFKKLLNGQTVQQAKTGVFYRDANGRSRKEVNTKNSPEETESVIVIHDPVKQELCFLETKSKTFSKISMHGVEQPFNDVLENFSKQGEYIGQQLIEGLNCHGYRSNQLGSGTIEYWVAEELQEVLLAKSTSGDEESILRLFSIRHIEPDSRMFTVPADFTEE